MAKAKVAVIMGSKSDMPTMEHCVNLLKEFKVPHVVRILSAHRTPKETESFVKSAKSKSIKVFIAAAGMAAHLGGVVASHTTLPVIGVPMKGSALASMDSLFSIVQMPGGVPVACMAIGNAGAKNAAIFATQILATSDKALEKKLLDYKKCMADAVLGRQCKQK